MNNKGLKQFVENLDEELKKLSDLIDWAHSNKLEFHITELDYYNDGENNAFNSVKKQAEVYQKLMNLLQKRKIKKWIGYSKFLEYGREKKLSW